MKIILHFRYSRSVKKTLNPLLHELFRVYGPKFVLFSIENTMRSRFNKRKYLHVGGYFAHLSIDSHLTNKYVEYSPPRLLYGGRSRACEFLRKGTCRWPFWCNRFILSCLLTLYCMNYFEFYGTKFVLFSIENTMQSRVNALSDKGSQPSIGQ